MVTWSGTSTNRSIAWLGVAVALMMLALSAWLWGSTTPSVVLVLNAVLAVAILVALVIAARLTVEVTTVSLVVRWGPTRWPVKVIRWVDVLDVTLVTVDPWDWGGWGYRWAPGGRGTAAVVRGGPGIQLDLVGGRRFTVTVDDADAGCSAAKLALAKVRPDG